DHQVGDRPVHDQVPEVVPLLHRLVAVEVRLRADLVGDGAAGVPAHVRGAIEDSRERLDEVPGRGQLGEPRIVKWKSHHPLRPALVEPPADHRDVLLGVSPKGIVESSRRAGWWDAPAPATRTRPCSTWSCGPRPARRVGAPPAAPESWWSPPARSHPA